MEDIKKRLLDYATNDFLSPQGSYYEQRAPGYPGIGGFVNLHDDILQLIADHDRLEKQRGWQPIETMPYNEYVLVSHGGGYFVNMGIRKRINGEERGVFHSTGEVFNTPTHWFPLPTPPTEE